MCLTRRLLPFAALGLLAAALPPGPAVDATAHARELLKPLIGTFDVESSFMGMASKGTEVNTVLTHGLTLVTDYRSPLGPGQEFEGHGLMGYDVLKDTWTSVWADNMSPGINVSEGHWSADGKTFTVEDTTDMGTGPMKVMMVTALQADGSRIFTMTAKDAAPDAAPLMKATYKPRAAGAR